MGFFISLVPLKPTKKGLAFVQTAEFNNACLTITRDYLAARRDYEVIEGALRRYTVAKLMPDRTYSEQEVIDFYSRNWLLIDGAWKPCVQELIADYERMKADPLQWLRDRGLIPAKPSGIASVDVINSPLPSGAHYHNLKEGDDFTT
jgi:hypothetical protein